MKRVVDKIVHEEEVAFCVVALLQFVIRQRLVSPIFKTVSLAGGDAGDADDAGHQDPDDVCADDAGTVVGAARCSLK